MIIDLDKINDDYQGEIDKFSLYSGADIYSKELNLFFHQPKVIDYGFIGEEFYLKILSLFSLKKEMFDKEKLSEEEREEIKQLSNFDFVLTTLDNDKELKNKFNDLLLIMFPTYNAEINFKKGYISFTYINTLSNNKEIVIYITKLNYNIFNFYIKSILDIAKDEKKEFNPMSDLSKRIANDIERARKRVSGKSGEDKKFSLLTNAVSCVSAGASIPINVILYNYTIIQLFDNFQRFKKYEDYHQSIDSIYAGAQDVEVKNWLGDI